MILIFICLLGVHQVPIANNAAHAVAAIAASRQFFRIVNKRREHDDSNADEKHQQTKYAGAGTQRRNDNFQTGIIVEQLKESHDTYRADEIPCRMRIVVLLKQKIVVHQIHVEPQVGAQVDPVDDVFEKFHPIRRHKTLDYELERKPRNAHVFDVVEHGGHALSRIHRQIDHARLSPLIRVVLSRHGHFIIVTLAK